MTTTEEWVKVGAEVASLSFGQNPTVTYSRINRIGKMWLFLDNGEKFHVLGLDRAEGPVRGGKTFKLFPADHPRVKEAELNVEVKRILREAHNAAKAFVDDPSVENAERVVLACIPYTKFDVVQRNDII